MSFHWLARKKKSLSPTDAADLVGRFLEGTELYPQEWNDFIEAVRVEPPVEAYRRECYRLDPMVNRPGSADPAAVEELRRIIAALRALT